jgi:hypothetical protein
MSKEMGQDLRELERRQRAELDRRRQEELARLRDVQTHD